MPSPAHTQAADARRALPCWDEPLIKASFDVTLIVPKDLVALSNMVSIIIHLIHVVRYTCTCVWHDFTIILYALVGKSVEIPHSDYPIQPTLADFVFLQQYTRPCPIVLAYCSLMIVMRNWCKNYIIYVVVKTGQFVATPLNSNYRLLNCSIALKQPFKKNWEINILSPSTQLYESICTRGGTTGAVQLRQLTIIIRPRRMFLLRVIRG